MTMRPARLALLFGSLSALAAACGSEDERPPASLEGGSGTATSGGKNSRAGSGSPSEAGEAPAAQGGADGGQGGAGGEGIVYEGAGAPAQIPGLCDPMMMPGADEAQALDPAVPGATLLSMTPDELSVVLVSGEAPSLLLHVADRAARDEPFTTVTVTLPAGYQVATGASISSDARELILGRVDQAGFGRVSRAARGAAFADVVDEGPFAKLNAQKAMSGRELGWPVLSSDGGTLYFLSYFGQGLVVQSTRGADGVFELGTEIDQYTLGGAKGEYKHINAVSVDERAIFFFDEATEHAMALFRSRPGAPFYEPIDLGARRGVVPNADCSRLYSSADGVLFAQELR